MITITVYGALFGILAVYLKSLRPGMIQHVMQDTSAGIIGALFLKRLGKTPAILLLKLLRVLGRAGFQTFVGCCRNTDGALKCAATNARWRLWFRVFI